MKNKDISDEGLIKKYPSIYKELRLLMHYPSHKKETQITKMLNKRYQLIDKAQHNETLDTLAMQIEMLTRAYPTLKDTDQYKNAEEAFKQQQLKIKQLPRQKFSLKLKNKTLIASKLILYKKYVDKIKILPPFSKERLTHKMKAGFLFRDIKYLKGDITLNQLRAGKKEYANILEQQLKSHERKKLQNDLNAVKKQQDKLKTIRKELPKLMFKVNYLHDKKSQIIKDYNKTANNNQIDLKGYKADYPETQKTFAKILDLKQRPKLKAQLNPILQEIDRGKQRIEEYKKILHKQNKEARTKQRITPKIGFWSKMRQRILGNKSIGH